MFENQHRGAERKPYIVEGGPVNIDSAHALIEKLNKSLEAEGVLTEDETAELQEKLKTLHELQETLKPVPQEVNTAIAQLIEIRNRHEGLKEAA